MTPDKPFFPIETATPRDAARLMEQVIQVARDAQDALLRAEESDYGPMERLEAASKANLCRDVGAAVAQSVQVVIRRHTEMERQMAQIRDLPEAGEDR